MHRQKSSTRRCTYLTLISHTLQMWWKIQNPVLTKRFWKHFENIFHIQKITKKGKINAVVSTLWILILALARRKPRHVDQCQQNKSKKFKDYRSLSSTLKASSYLHAKRYKTHQRTVRWLFPIKRFWKISKTRTNDKLKKNGKLCRCKSPGYFKYSWRIIKYLIFRLQVIWYVELILKQIETN